jgi:hypothetical protein
MQFDENDKALSRSMMAGAPSMMAALQYRGTFSRLQFPAPSTGFVTLLGGHSLALPIPAAP